MGKQAPTWAWWVATGFGSGRLPWIPGTWGSLAGLLAWLLFTAVALTPFTTWAISHPRFPHLQALALGVEALILALLMGLTYLAVRASDRVAEDCGLKDPGFIVADEWVGMAIALWPLRWILAQELFRFASPQGLRWVPLLLLPFLAFRLFDIWKPWPIRQLQDLPGGQGVVADDVVAGLYALVLTQLLFPLLLQLTR